MQLLNYSLTPNLEGRESGPRSAPITPQLCSAMNAYKGWFNRDHLAKVVAAQGLSVFDRELNELVDAILREGGVEVAFAPRYPKSSASRVQPLPADT